jgi:hypothetical protein
VLLLQYCLKFFQMDNYVDFIRADNELSEDCQILVISCPKWPSLDQPVCLQASRALNTLSREYLARKLRLAASAWAFCLHSLALVTVRAVGVYNAFDMDNSVSAISVLGVSSTVNIIHAGSVCDVAGMIR